MTIETARTESLAYADWMNAHGYEASVYMFSTALDNYGPESSRTTYAAGYAVRYAGQFIRDDGSRAEYPTAGITVFCEDDAKTPDHLIDMDEYRAWCEGEVFGFVVEKNELWHKDSNPGETMESWEIEDSCWGYYGDNAYTRSSALDALAYAVKSDIPVPVPFWTRVVQRVQRIFRMKS